MMAQLKLTADVFHPQRYSQLAGPTPSSNPSRSRSSSATAAASSRCAQGLVHHAGGAGAGDVLIGPYRLVYLLMAGCYLAALFGVNRLQHHMRKHTGPEGYVAPL